MSPKVSIIITTFNRCDLLKRAVNSVISQNYKNFEVIIIDDCSTDDTKLYLEELKYNKIISNIILNNKNLGQTATKNIGLDYVSSSNSKYFCFFDSDDIMLPDAISDLVEDFERLGNTVSQVFGICKDLESGHFTGSHSGNSRYVTFEDALTGRFKGEYWQLIRTDFLGDQRFDNRAAGGLSLVWHGLLKIAPGYISNSVVRIYDQSSNNRLSVPLFDEKRSRRKMYTYLAYLQKFKNELLIISPQRYGYIALDVARWAKLAGENMISAKYIVFAFGKAPMKDITSTALQLIFPKKVIRFLKENKHKRVIEKNVSN